MSEKSDEKKLATVIDALISLEKRRLKRIYIGKQGKTLYIKSITMLPKSSKVFCE